MREDSPVSHLFDGITVTPDAEMTDEEAEQILHGNPPDRTDLTDLITPDNQGDVPTAEEYRELMTGHLKPGKQSKKSS